MGNVPRASGATRHPHRRAPAPEPPAPAEVAGGDRLIDLRDVPSRWPTLDGMVNPAPHAWRYEFDAERLAVVDAFYRDLLWNVQLEMDGVAWPGRSPRPQPSIVAALRDVARLWHLPSAEEPLPTESERRRATAARRQKERRPGSGS